MKRILLFIHLSFLSLNLYADLSRPVPDEGRFEVRVLHQGMEKPMTMAVTPDGRVIWLELNGLVRVWHPGDGRITEAARFDVFSSQESGLLGIVLDPHFEQNQWLYIKYSDPVNPREVIARFTLTGDVLDRESETLILDYKTDREKDNCCHEAGSLAFGPDGCLYISAGDNTHPGGDSKGYAPLDEREGRLAFNAQRTSGNTMDLRGAVLRVRPLPQGGYEIPEGNLFPKGGAIKGAPEIFAKGCRNPWRISVDPKSGYLYWGDVGPDAGGDLKGRGPMGHDEINQAKKAGYFGWPYFVGPNLAYWDWDFETNTGGERYDAARPVNNWEGNSGSRELPPAQPAWIYYPGRGNEVFPETGKGGRTACAGPAYHFEEPFGSIGLPDYYDNCLFVYEWSRHWILAVHLDEDSNIVKLDRFMPNTQFKRPIDLKFGPRGELYVIEYGETWGVNEDARLIQITYNRGNRAPIAKASIDGNIGKGPLKVRLDASASTDKDGDALTFSWKRSDKPEAILKGRRLSMTFEKKGVHQVELTVTDPSGGRSSEQLPVLVGNAKPELSFLYPRDKSLFRWEQKLRFKLAAFDLEDDEEMGKITVRGEVVGSAGSSVVPIGLQRMQQSDCLNCHAVTHKLVGPAFTEIAKRYRGQEGALEASLLRVKNGSSGVWGEAPMLPHPQHSEAEIRQMLTWIFDLKESNAMTMADSYSESVIPTGKAPESGGALFRLVATYTDKGSAPVGPLTTMAEVTLRSPRFEAEDCLAHDKLNISGNNDGGKGQRNLGATLEGSWAHYGEVNLSGIREVIVRASSGGRGGRAEFRDGGVKGTLLGSVQISSTGDWGKYQDFSGGLKAPEENVDLYLHMTGGNHMMNVNWFEFR